MTWQRIHLADEKLHEIFDTLDTEGLGYLTAETIQAAVGVDFGPEQIAQMIAEADTDHDGRVDYADPRACSTRRGSPRTPSASRPCSAAARRGCRSRATARAPGCRPRPYRCTHTPRGAGRVLYPGAARARRKGGGARGVAALALARAPALALTRTAPAARRRARARRPRAARRRRATR